MVSYNWDFPKGICEEGEQPFDELFLLDVGLDREFEVLAGFCEQGAVVAHISPFLSSKEKAEKKEGGTPKRISK